jgi:hypothetical protein
MRRVLHVGSASASTIRAREEIATSGGEAYRSMAAACTVAALYGARCGRRAACLAVYRARQALPCGCGGGELPVGTRARCGEAPVGSRDKWLYFSYTLLSVSVFDPKQTLGEP